MDALARTLPPSLRADCSRCAGLCCVAPAFYAVQGFAFDKPACTACPHLQDDDRCAIHGELAERGFPGCVSFECHGAGQRVTQELFGGASWRDSAGTAARMFRAYAVCLALHELMAMLALAEVRLAPPLTEQLRAKRAELEALSGSSEAKDGSLDVAALRRGVRALLPAKRA